MNDLEIYKKAAQILGKGENIALITVISTTGSTPGKVGYKMLVWAENANTLGTIGGGLVEAEIIDAAKNVLPTPENRVVKISLGKTEDDERGICGGSIEFLIESFDKENLTLFDELAGVMEKGDKGVLASIISPERPPEKIFSKDTEQIKTITNIKLTDEDFESINKIVSREQSEKITSGSGAEMFIETIAEQPMVIIFGAGHIAYYISRYVKSLNFRLTVCDDRAEFANKARFPQADNVVVEDFESIFDKIEVRGNSYIVIATKGHRFDETVLEKAVKTNAKYIGMIGSKRKILTIFKHLAERGVSEQTLKKVHSPIGVSIGAVTPEEIALSIAAELVKIRRLGDTSETNHTKMDFQKGKEEEES
jgi:xanthine dehydrogenase accessory factor